MSEKLGALVIYEDCNGLTAAVRWEDGEREVLSCGSEVTLKNGESYCLEMGRRKGEGPYYYLVHYGSDIEGLIVKKIDDDEDDEY